MLDLTQDERRVLIGLAAILLIGQGVLYWQKVHPEWLHFMEQPSSYPKLNVNTASLQELVNIPYIGQTTANKLIANRPFSNLNDIQNVKGIYPKNFHTFKHYLVVR